MLTKKGKASRVVRILDRSVDICIWQVKENTDEEIGDFRSGCEVKARENFFISEISVDQRCEVIRRYI